MIRQNNITAASSFPAAPGRVLGVAVGLALLILTGNTAGVASVPGDELWSADFAYVSGRSVGLVGGSDLAASGLFNNERGFAVWREGNWLPLAPEVDETLYDPWPLAGTRFQSKLHGVIRYYSTVPYTAPQRLLYIWDADGTTLLRVGNVMSWAGAYDTVNIFAVEDRLLVALEGSIRDATNDPYAWTYLAAVAGGRVRDMTSWNGRLAVAGPFTAVGGVPARQLAWQGPDGWQEVGGGFVGIYPVVAAWCNSLFVGGALSVAGSLPIANIASFDGVQWSAMGGGLDGQVLAMESLECGLIVGGAFHTAGGVPAAHIARWDGTRWWPLGSGTNADVSSLAWYDGQLYVSGSFTEAGGKPARYLSAWRPSQVPVFLQSFRAVREPSGGVRVTWDLGEPTEGMLRLERSDAGGASVVVSAVAADRTHFELLDPDAPGTALVYRLRADAVDDLAGDVLAEARVEGGPPAATRLLAPVPNPFNPSVTLRFTLARSGSARLAIHDARGRQVRALLDGALPAGEHALAWDGLDERGAAQPSGVYIACLVTDDRVESAKLNLVR